MELLSHLSFGARGRMPQVSIGRVKIQPTHVPIKEAISATFSHTTMNVFSSQHAPANRLKDGPGATAVRSLSRADLTPLGRLLGLSQSTHRSWMRGFDEHGYLRTVQINHIF